VPCDASALTNRCSGEIERLFRMPRSPADAELNRYTALGLSRDSRKPYHGSAKALLKVGSRQSHFWLAKPWLTADVAEVPGNETAL